QAVQEGLEAYDRRHGWRGAEAHDQPLDKFRAYANTYPAQVTQVGNSSFEALMQDGSSVTVPWSGMSWARRFRNVNSVGGAPSKASEIVKVKDIVRLRPNENKTSWSLVQIPNVQGQLIAINPNNGAIEAIVGGYNFYQSKFNRATQGWRQPGSTIKPFVYALALERGMTPHTMVNDAPITIGKWTPRNSDGRYLGMIPLRRALYLSRNTVSVRLLQAVGIERTRQLFMDFGLQDSQIPRNYTIALGTPQVLPIQMATGYATFANGGYRIQPHFITRIEDAYGNTIFEAKPEYACISCINAKEETTQTTDPITADDEAIVINNTTLEQKQVAPKVSAEDSNYRQAQRILKSSSAYDMANILRDVIQHGTGRAALRIGRSDIGGKTGTTNDAKDAWFAGFNGKLVTVTWVGFDQPTTLGRREYGGVAALPIWTDFMGKALKGQPEAWVRLDRNAKAPVNRNKAIQADEQQNDPSSPPLATALYRPAPVVVPKRTETDFEDLPDQPIRLPDDEGSAPQEQPLQPNRVDSLENLIEEVQ
ncbi:MAG TPA: penicillin-binding protein, partial [Acinetobacter lwoffii]|nr:penicillin-binding protein [Acinetobacter lwoffii]